MATITPAAVYPVQAPFNTSPTYSGTFIPTLWSAKLNEKFYTATVFAEIANTKWEGEIKSMGDKVIINNVPTLTIRQYKPGAGLTYEVPTPETLELVIDKGRYFAFHVNDLLALQSQPKLMDMFSNDAGMQMKIQIDSNVIYRTFNEAHASNVGATAGVKSGSYNLGTEADPYQLAASGSSAIDLITRLSAVLDEQNVPETDRWLLISPADRQALLNSNLQQAYLTGDDKSILRNGKIGMIDRFTIYVSNNMPTMAANGTDWLPGAGSSTEYDALVTGDTDTQKRRAILAGHKSALTFASQMTKLETVRNQNDFGDFVRGMNVYGFKVVKPESLALAVVY